MRNYLNGVWKVLGLTGFVFMSMFFTLAAFAAEGDISEMQWIADAIAAVKGMGGADGLAIASAVIMLIVSLFKVPFFREKIWDKLKFNQKAIIPLALGLIAGVLKLDHITLGGLVTYLGAGVGAMALYEIIDVIKLSNGINATVKGVLSFIQGILKTGK
jgi:hypothetical protein